MPVVTIWFKEIIILRGVRCHGSKRKDTFVKCDVLRNNYCFGVEIKTSKIAMIFRIIEKNKWSGR